MLGLAVDVLVENTCTMFVGFVYAGLMNNRDSVQNWIENFNSLIPFLLLNTFEGSKDVEFAVQI